MIGLCLMAVAFALDPAVLEKRLAEVEELRQWRIQAAAPKVSAADVRKVAGGEVITGLGSSSTGSKAYGAALISMPVGRFWAGLNDETRHPGYTAVSYSELVSGSVCKSRRRVLQYLPVPWLADRWWIGAITLNSKIESLSGGTVRELSFESSVDASEITSSSGKTIIAKAEPIGFSKGGWFVVAVDDRHTYVEYYLWTDPGGRIPASMASMFATKGVRENIAAITKFANQGKPSCPVY